MGHLGGALSKNLLLKVIQVAKMDFLLCKGLACQQWTTFDRVYISNN